MVIKKSVYLIILLICGFASSLSAQEFVILNNKFSCEYSRGKVTIGTLHKGKFTKLRRAKKKKLSTRYRRLRKKCKRKVGQLNGATNIHNRSTHVPGSTITVPFPDMPQAMHGDPYMRITFPNNYTGDEVFPVIVYLNGYHMSPTTILSWADNFIWVGLPGFQSDFSLSHSVVDIADAEATLPLHEIMINHFKDLVPNASRNKQQWAYGGFSNGAHMAAAMLASPLVRERLLALTNNIYFIDGGADDFSDANPLLLSNNTSSLRICASNCHYQGSFPLSMGQDHTHGHRVIGQAFFAEYVNTFLTVTSPPTQVPPSISNRRPDHNESAYLGETVWIYPIVNDPNNDITKVEFYVNGVKIGEDTTYPYKLSWIPSAEGSYPVHAKAFDSHNHTATSIKNTIHVFPAAPDGIQLEAEDGDISGQLAHSTSNGGYRSIYLRQGDQPTGYDTLDLTVDIPTAGYYKIGAQTHSPNVGYPIDISVSGSLFHWIVDSSAGWLESFATDTSGEQISVYMDAGVNTLSLTWLGTSSLAYVDYLVLEYDQGTISPPAYVLSVEGGQGDGAYLPGERVTVLADSPMYLSQEFDQWEGDISNLVNRYSDETELIMPESDTTILATYRVRELFMLGDANGDELIDGQDFIILKNNYLTNVVPFTIADFNGDGVIDFSDFNIWNENFSINKIKK